MKYRALLAVAPLVVLTACRSTGVSIPLGDGDPRASQWLQSLGARARERTAMRAHARLVLDAPDFRFRRPQRFVAHRPGRLRLEVLGLFDQVVAVLTTDDGRYQLFDAGTGAVERGVVTQELLWRVARVDLSPVEVVDLLLGAPAPPARSTPGRARALDEGGVGVEFFDEKGVARRRYEFDTEGRLSRVTQRDAQERVVWEARWADYRELDGSAVAFELELGFPRLAAKAQLRLQQVELNPDLPAGVFDLGLSTQSSAADLAIRGGG